MRLNGSFEIVSQFVSVRTTYETDRTGQVWTLRSWLDRKLRP